MIYSLNPATGQSLEEYQADSAADLERKLNLAVDSFTKCRHSSFSDRAKWLKRAAEVLTGERQALATLMTLEMGKPICSALQEIDKCASVCRYYAQNGKRLLAAENCALPNGNGRVEYQPLGVVLAIMPWNFPFWQVFRFAAPALMAGNVGLLKHASNVPRCALRIEEVFRKAGVPEGAFQVLLIGSAGVGEIIADRRVSAVTLTGSVEAGRKVAAAAGQALKKTVLELGGSDPFIVMPSADLEHAATMAVRARVINNGQSCIAAKRFIVHRDVKEQFTRLLVERMGALRVGDPTAEETDVGPLATEEVLRSLVEQVERTVSMGARILLGGQRLNRPGFFFAPTVLDAVPPGSPADQEELFGPVASLFAANDIRDALRIANGTAFGLGASIWTRNQEEQDYFVSEVQSGLAFVNEMVVSDPRLPFGGIKESGYGRELGRSGIREFVNTKAVLLKDETPAGQ
jgi:succinate-semialdehyde dehydrogenase/glutarate-semialdehyde dehydrogenase